MIKCIAYYASVYIDLYPVSRPRMLPDDVTPSFPIIGINKNCKRQISQTVHILLETRAR